MTKLVEQALDRAYCLLPEMQDEIVRMVLSHVGDDDDPIELKADEDAAIVRSLEAAARGEFATDEQVRALWARHGL